MAQIIANHSIVEDYRKIPPRYITDVKRMLANFPGESHSSGYRIGVQLLQAVSPALPCSVTDLTTAIETYRTDALRVAGAHRTASGWAGVGEEEWYTNAAGIAEMKNHLSYCAANSRAIALMGFGWCWDATWHNGVTAEKDPVYGCGWAGSSESGPEGDLPWGLDAEDTAITGNSVCLDTYLAATEEYIAYCLAQGLPAKIAFTTGAIDGQTAGTELGYQRHLKYERIRNYVAADESRILFDYADILSWSDAGDEFTAIWSGHAYNAIHSDNMLDLDGTYAEDGDHIGERGALRIGKALWWLMARIAGWDGLREDHSAKRVMGVRI